VHDSVRKIRNSRIKTIFVDEINLLSLLKLSLFLPSPDRIVYFEPLSRSGKIQLELFQMLYLIRARTIRVTDHIGMVRNGTGEGQFLKCIANGRKICRRISETHIRTQPLIRAMSRFWDGRKLRLYFEKLIEGRHISGEVTRECIRIGLTEWLISHRFQVDKTECALLIQRKKWFSYIKAHASSRDIFLAGYHSVLFRFCGIGFRLAVRLARHGIRFMTRLFTRKYPEPEKDRNSFTIDPASDKRAHKAHAIAVRYMGGKIGFEDGDRTELFWLNNTQLTSVADIIFYNVHRDDNPIDPEILAQLESDGIRMFGSGPGIASWQPSKQRLMLLVSILVRLASGTMTCLRKGDWVSPYYVHKLASLAWDYSYWLDFYAANRVMMDVCANNRTLGQTLALDAMGGISVAYQYSISNFYSILGLTAGEDIQFLFSESFEKPWLQTGYPAGCYVYTGYLYDNAFSKVMESVRAGTIRKQLEKNGARFVLCFFDENSIPRWDMPVNHPEAAADYRYLLEWLLEDPELGIVFKPKRARDLFHRLAPIHTLIEASQNTGRCVYFLSDTVVGDVYPAEAARMADISIGKLSGGTAALEAQLVGIPSLLIDDEGLHSHPFQKWGKETVVVKKWQAARSAVDEFRRNRESQRKIGNWTQHIDRIDPFLDGQAGRRMGFFLQTAFEAVAQGTAKHAGIHHAQEIYRSKWGGATIHVPEI